MENRYLNRFKKWWALPLVVLILVFFAYSYKSTGKHYLPLALPLILTALATIIRGSEEGKISLRGFTIDLALGVVSFNVWAINSVLASQGKMAMLTPTRVLDPTDTIYCLILALVLVGGCTWMSKEKETLNQTSRVDNAGVCGILLCISSNYCPTSYLAGSASQIEEPEVRCGSSLQG